MSPRLFVISGPSGVGKGTLIARARDLVDDLEVATSATTRPPRPEERDGREYHFLTDAEFARRAAAGEFLEHVRYAGNRYGTLRSEVDRRLANGKSVVLEIEVVGAREIKRRMPEAVLVFVAPPTFADLERRLRVRGSDSPGAIADRIAIARGEMDAQPEFQETIVNDDVDRAARQLAGLVREATGTGETA
ncbi:MAG TPA: guanylate kinase [Gaiellales bacterium]|nr:guanylate kinase [Gaiellales bacterium]